MSADRRGFLRQLASLPLIGGGVTLIGQPKAVAEPITRQLMFEYGQWLSWERVAAYRVINGNRSSWPDDEASGLEYHRAYAVAQHMHGPLAGRDTYEGQNANLRSHAYRWHREAAAATARAALVLSTVGVDWRGPYLPREVHEWSPR